MHPKRKTYNPPYTSQFDDYKNVLLKLNIRFKSLTDRRKVNDQEIINHEANYDKNNNLSASQGRALQRQFETLNLHSSTIQRDEAEMLKRIELLAAILSGYYQDIVEDYNSGEYLSEFGFNEILKGYQVVISTGNNLPCFTKPPFDKILLAILKHLPA